MAIAHLVAKPVDGNLHIDQVSAHPAHSRRGVGRHLIEHAAKQARVEGLPALTLTTFRDVPWNGPYYIRCGFHILDEAKWGPQLHAIRRTEAQVGLDRWPRVAMRRDL